MLPDGVRHGTSTAHAKYRCRCEPCCAWRLAYDAAYRDKRRAAGLLGAPTGPRPGAAVPQEALDPETREAYWAREDAAAREKRRARQAKAKARANARGQPWSG